MSDAALVLGGEQDALAEEREPCLAEHLALDHFDVIHSALYTGPELMVRPLVTASRSCSSHLANDAMPGGCFL